MSDKPEKIYAYPGSLIYSLKPALPHTVEYIRADLAKPSEWINVADLLPVFDEKVLICKENRTRKISFLSDRYGPTEWDCFGGVTHWQPLPPPPTRETP